MAHKFTDEEVERYWPGASPEDINAQWEALQNDMAKLYIKSAILQAVAKAIPLEKNADGNDIIETIVMDASADEPFIGVHEGGSYYAERLIRRAILQGKLTITDKARRDFENER